MLLCEWENNSYDCWVTTRLWLFIFAFICIQNNYPLYALWDHIGNELFHACIYSHVFLYLYTCIVLCTQWMFTWYRNDYTASVFRIYSFTYIEALPCVTDKVAHEIRSTSQPESCRCSIIYIENQCFIHKLRDSIKLESFHASYYSYGFRCVKKNAFACMYREMRWEKNHFSPCTVHIYCHSCTKAYSYVHRARSHGSPIFRQLQLFSCHHVSI